MPADLIEGVRGSHVALHSTVRRVDDLITRSPSRLPGWTVGHVLTHLARNADSVVRRLQAAADGHPVQQYAGGSAGRDADIAAGAGRPAAELVTDLVTADEAVDRFLAAAPPSIWDLTVPGAGGRWVTPERVVFSRWREIEVHHLDLGLGHEPADWPPALVALMLPDLLDGLADRTTPAALSAWAMDRAPAPKLRSWD